jgi:SsrA-binding protein
MPHQKGIKPVAQNKKAYHEYFVEETYECGLCLKGTEVKSMRQGRVNLKESFCMIRNGEIFAEGMHISPYEFGNIHNNDPLRPKKLLMHKNEIRKLAGEVSKQGYTVIPLKVYLKDSRMKLEIGLCKGKHLHDKRDAAAARDAQREVARALSRRRDD